MKNIMKKSLAFVASSVCMLSFVGLNAHGNTEVANAAATTDKVFNLVKNATSFELGTEIIITNSKSTTAMAVQKEKNWSETAITASNGTITVGTDFAGQIFTIGKGKKPDTYSIQYGDKFICATGGSKKNYLQSKTALDDNGSWTITADKNGIATINANGTSSRNKLRYNSSNVNQNTKEKEPLFSCYGSGQDDISIYAYVKPVVPGVSTKVVYINNNGTPNTEVLDQTTLPSEEDLLVGPTTIPTNKYFGGWFEDELCTIPATPNKTLEGGEIKLYAKWLDYLKVTFHNNDGTDAKTVVSEIKPNEKVASSKITPPTREGYIFDRWVIGAPDAVKGFYLDSTKVTENLDVYATWGLDLNLNSQYYLGASYTATPISAGFSKVTSLDELTTGEYFIATTNTMLGNNITEDNGRLTGVSFNDINKEMETLKTNGFTFTVTEALPNQDKKVTIKSNANDLYLGKSSNQDCLNKTTPTTFGVNFNANGEVNIYDLEETSNEKYLRYNDGAKYFRFYKPTSVKSIYLYKIGNSTNYEYTELRSRIAFTLDKAFLEANPEFKLGAVINKDGKYIDKQLTSYITEADGSRTYVLAIRAENPKDFAIFGKRIEVTPYVELNGIKHNVFNKEQGTENYEKLKYDLSLKHVVNTYLGKDDFVGNVDNAAAVELLKDLQTKIG